ncbi:MAG TPA: hypothetical protein VLA46_06370, partial [Saprospiraceae bacterium]|nr:hypothetical protein [Saprospiraceae bacterium]
QGISIGERIMDFNNNTYMWPVKQQGAPGDNTFRISEPIGIPTFGFLQYNFRKTPVPGSNYYVHKLPDVKTGSMRVGSIRTPIASIPRNRLVFQNLNITGDMSPDIDMGTELFCYGCSLRGSIQLASGFARNFVNCFQHGGQTIRIISGLTRFMAGAYVAFTDSPPPFPVGVQSFLPTNCSTQFDFDVVFQGHSISVVAGNTLIIGTAGIFDSEPGGNGGSNPTGNGIMVSGGSVTCRNLQDKTTPSTSAEPPKPIHHLWGSGQKGHGVGVSSGGRFYYVSNPPTITGLIGSGKDYSLGGSTNTNTWSNLDANGNAKNPDYDALILKTQ